MLEVIVLAAGKGTRMRSDLPKVLHTLAGKPFLAHVLECAETLAPVKTHLVVGHGADQVKATISGYNLAFVEQTEQLGTGHAVMQAMPGLSEGNIALILYGDVPLIASDTLKRLVESVNDNTMGLLTVSLDDPTGYGRIIRDESGAVLAIVEQKDANAQQQLVNEVNTGVMAVAVKDLNRWLPKLSQENAQKEYLLTDIIAMAREDGIDVVTSNPDRVEETLGVNNRQQQASLERIKQSSIAEELMANGLTLLDPARLDVRGRLTVGKDCVVDVNCVFEGDVTLGDGVYIGPNCTVKDAVIGNGVEIKSHSVVDDATIGDKCVLGPYARIRPKTVLESSVKIGNFVEIKKANVGEGSKVNHLSYVGDAEIGSNVNIGAGTITCNYDGVNKFVTTIGDDVFVGSNTALVAPVDLKNKVTVAAGSVVTVDAEQETLVVARSRQRNIDGWIRPTKK